MLHFFRRSSSSCPQNSRVHLKKRLKVNNQPDTHRLIEHTRSLENTTNPTAIANIVQEKPNELKLRGINITFIWEPGHANVKGNEMADQAAKEAAQPDNHIIQLLDIVTYGDIKTHNKNKFQKKYHNKM